MVRTLVGRNQEGVGFISQVRGGSSILYLRCYRENKVCKVFLHYVVEGQYISTTALLHDHLVIAHVSGP